MLSAIKTVSMASALVLAAAITQPAAAAPVLGAQVYYSGGDITVTTLPVTSGYVSELGLYDGTGTRLAFLTLDEPAGVSVTFNPGALGLAVNDELLFGIYVRNIGTTFYIGPASRNPDGVIHAAVDSPYVAPGLGTGVVVGFEDLYGGGDRDYDDNKFFFTGGIRPVPEPATLALVGIALGGWRLARRRRQ